MRITGLPTLYSTLGSRFVAPTSRVKHTILSRVESVSVQIVSQYIVSEGAVVRTDFRREVELQH